MNKLSLLTYTHSNCSDIHPLYLDSSSKYFNEINHYLLTNNDINDKRVTQILYDDTQCYYEQMLLGLSSIQTKYVIYSQEDYILYNYVDLNMINKYVEFLENDDNINFIRLIQSGIYGNEKEYNDDLLIINNDSEYFFSTQITIWRKEILEKLLSLSKPKYITDEPKNSSYLKSIEGIGLCTKLKGDKIGGHYNSVIYPYMATAIIKGKWNFTEYGDKLEELLNRYDIDKNKRDIF